MHARGVVLELELLELAQLGEVDHGVVAGARLARGEPHHDPVEHDVVARGEVGVEADAQLDEGRQAPVHPDPAAVDAVDPGQALQQRALAAAVAPGDPEELALAHVEGDVVERLEGLVAGAAQRVERALLERVRALLRHTEGLADRARRRSAARRCWSVGASEEGYRFEEYRWIWVFLRWGLGGRESWEGRGEGEEDNALALEDRESPGASESAGRHAQRPTTRRPSEVSLGAGTRSASDWTKARVSASNAPPRAGRCHGA